MPTAIYDKVYSVPLAYKRPEPRLDPVSEELEFSEYGRSSLLLAGWYLAPALIVIPIALLFLLI